MGIGLGVIVSIAVGLPLLALAVVRRLPPPRLRAFRPDPLYEWSRRHRLSAGDHARIEEAVRDGRRVTPERLVPAAREYAELILGATQRHGRAPVRRRALRRALIVVYLLALAFCVWKVPGGLGGFAAGLTGLLLARRNAKQARRALAANADPAVADPATGNGASATNLPPSLT